MDSLVTLKRMVSTSTIHRRSKFCTMGWQFYTDILQGVYIPTGKQLSSNRDFRKNSQEDFFASLSQETIIYSSQETVHCTVAHGKKEKTNKQTNKTKQNTKTYPAVIPKLIFVVRNVLKQQCFIFCIRT